MPKSFFGLNRQISLVGLISGLALLLLSACGDATPTTAPSSTTQSASAPTTASGPSSATTVSSSQEAVTLEFWTMPNTGQAAKDLQATLADFYKQNPNIKVNVTEVSWGDAFGKIQTALQSGVGPDITQLGTTWVATFGSTGGLRPFSDAEVQAVGGEKAFSPAAWNTTHLAGTKDIVAMPWFVETRALLYRKDVLAKAGLDGATAFKDWDTFAASLKKMKDSEGDLVKAPFAITGKNDNNVTHNLMPWVWAAGGNILNEDNTKAAINSDTALRGVQTYVSFFTSDLTYKPAIEKNVNDLEALFRAGDIGSMISGPWMIVRSKRSKTEDANGYAGTITAQNLGTAMLPAGPNGVHPFVGGSDLAILKSSKHPEAAVKLVQYLASKKGQLDYQKLVGNLPANVEAQSDPLYADPLYKAYLDSLKTGYSYPVVPAWGAIEQDLKKTFSTMWDDVVAGKGNDAIKKRLDEAANQLNLDIANAR
ncbi:MAG TPA: sugar ABC transporter substrate-binding protein [Chloroflexia bacterium]|nr:sugar ABC transporter substrate-binding protein [Chloroflexia bacterium]